MNTSTINQLISVVPRLVFGRYLYDSMQIVDSHMSDVQVQQELHLNKFTVYPMVSFDSLWSTSPHLTISFRGEKASLWWLEVSLVLPRPFEERHPVLQAPYKNNSIYFCSRCFSLFWYFHFCFHSNRERPLQSTAQWLQSWRVSEGCTSTTASAACPLRRPRTPQPPSASGNSARGSSRRDPPPLRCSDPSWPRDPRRVTYMNVTAT